jgi:hypothetical protein
MTSTKKAKDLSDKVEGAEYFVKEDGTLGAVLPHYAPDHIRPLYEWRQEGDGIAEYLDEQLSNAFWPICGAPTTGEDPALFEDLERFIRDHVYFQDEAIYETVTSWAICTWIKEALRIAPRPIFYGTTASGKSRAINTLREVVYRGYVPTIPTPAVLYALIERYQPTIFIDEYQAIKNPEKLNDIEAVFRAGYERGGTVPRMNPNTMEPIIHHVYGFMGIGTKGRLPPEDLVNRALIVNMQQKPKEAAIARRIDDARGQALRGRLLGLRLRVLSGEVSIAAERDRAVAEALRPVMHRGASTELGDRPVDLAESLLVPPLLFGRPCGILGVIARCQAESRDELVGTLEGRTFHALQACYRGCPPLKTGTLEGQPLRDIAQLTTLNVADQLNLDLMEQEGRDTYTKRTRIETHTVTSWLKTLGFSFRRGTGNRSYFLDDGFMRAYRTNLDKYGVREGCPDIRGRQLTIADGVNLGPRS